jgi:hypothetical protein
MELTEGIEKVPSDFRPTPQPQLHRGYVRVTQRDLIEAEGGKLKIMALGDGPTFCVIDNITILNDGTGPAAFTCTSGGRRFEGRLTTCTSFWPAS